MPPEVEEIKLTSESVLDLKTNIDEAINENINVGGVAKDLQNFTSGNLDKVDLTVAKKVASVEIVVTKAVQLQSGTDTKPIIIKNTALPSVEVSIPDETTILASSGWDGTIEPPKPASNSGTAPSGFSVGDTVIEVGSYNAVLLFDTPVTLVLSGVTGDVGYKPSGSDTWIQITETCGGTYANPSDPSVFPGECFISNGTDTKIVTFHFTSFGSLDSTTTTTTTASPKTSIKSGGSGNTGVGPSGGGSGTRGILSSIQQGSTDVAIPNWIKQQTITFWMNDEISDETFAENIRHLLDENIIDLDVPDYTGSKQADLPPSIKQLFGMWANDQLAETEILGLIHYYRSMGIW
ncbi:MAG: hypothetical protein J4F36_12290 [Nitrosopumilaceae archaeon]|nr:hypothetical protein [Nitrosopumilaceae archaeon]